LTRFVAIENTEADAFDEEGFTADTGAPEVSGAQRRSGR
jgi:hypothetical protein